MPETRIHDLLAAGAGNHPEVPCLLTPGWPVLTYARLHAVVSAATEDLRRLGVQRGHRIAAIFDNGFDMSCAFLAVTNLATLVPLQRGQTEEAFQHSLRLFAADALLLRAGQAPAAEKAAALLGLPLLIMMSPDAERPFMIAAAPGHGLLSPPSSREENDEIALLLPTSGTTTRPKIVPRTHANQCAGARSCVKAFALTLKDRLLNILPFERGSSYLAVATMLAAGGSIVNTGGVAAPDFFPLLAEFSPTCFTASPAVLESLADHAEKYGIRAEVSSLRYIRAAGARLSPELYARLYRIFGVPIHISYGMTEASLIACSYMAPDGYREGSVGVAIDEGGIGIMDDTGRLLPAGERGEVVVRGPNVFDGYEDNPEANTASFHNGWFRTGDQGYLDQDGYLYLTGRLKETINRGGEKVSPFEVEEAILEHPDVLQTAVFPVPSQPGSGECVAAAVVLRDGARLSLVDLRRFLRGKIGFFKMPTRLYQVTGIPVGPAGKIQRNTLYQQIERMALPGQSNVFQELVPPRNETEAKLVTVWQAILASDEIGVTDDFFDLGGDSLSVAQLYAEIETIWEIKIPLVTIYEESTIERLARVIEQTGKDSSASRILVPIQTGGRKPPLFCVHTRQGDVVTYRRLAHFLGGDQPVYGFRLELEDFRREDLRDIPGMAARYIREMRSFQPEGPYLLAGYSFAGLVAYEMACQLQSAGIDAAMLAMIDTQLSQGLDLINRLRAAFRQIRAARKGGRAPIIYLKVRRFFARIMRTAMPGKHPAWMKRKPEILRVLNSLPPKYKPGRWGGEIIYFKAEERDSETFSVQKWAKLAASVKVVLVPGNHKTMIAEPHVGHLARELSACIEQACASSEKTVGDPNERPSGGSAA